MKESVTYRLELARGFRETAPLSVAAIKTALRDASSGDPAGARQRARDAFSKLWFSADHKEAERAFAAKRAPRFIGA